MLATRIRTSTQSAHSTTLTLINARLPLALPPTSPTPATYATGLLHLAPIYTLLETLWTDTLCGPLPDTLSDPPSSRISKDRIFDCLLPPEARWRHILAAIHLPPVMRAHRIRSDILAITGWSPATYETRLRSVASHGFLADFLAHMDLTLRRKPHLIVTYSYLLHMAVFRGGQHIRATLEAADDSFWAQTPPPLRFFDLDDDSAGGDSDVPRRDPAGDYLSKLHDVEHLLTGQELREIVDEAHVVYLHLALVMFQLDELFGKGDRTLLDPNLST